MDAGAAVRRRPELASARALVRTISHDGRGIARLDGKTVFIEGALPGEDVEFRIQHRHRDYDEAQVQNILSASPERVTPLCEHFGVCGGCNLQHLAPAAQLSAKQQTLLDNFKRIGHVQPEKILAPLTGPVWGYRRRARLSVRQVPVKGRVLVGFVEKYSPHVTDTHRCETLHPKIGNLIQPLATLLGELSIADRIPQIEIAVGDTATVLVLRTLSPISKADHGKLSVFEWAHDLRFYLQPGRKDTAVPLNGERASLSYRLPDWDVEITFEPADFIQVNAEINRQLVNRVIEVLQVEPGHRVLDLFCGLGNFTLPLARVAKEAVGVEGEIGLVQRAHANAERNCFSNVRFHQADLFTDQKDALWLKQTYHRLLLDPPRAGAREILACLGPRLPQRVVYVSCHPATLARDTAVLVQEHGYRLLSAGVLDMFPHTAHVESIAVLEKVA